tara:strand:- start:1186 stop:1860 length:675 start_codon:yes stop_codon:yes gene_type:complete
MELNDTTLEVLKNFASINPNLVVKVGDEISTITEAKNVLASAKIDIPFPKEFGVYNLSEFLNVLNLVDKPTLKFDDNFVIISDSSGRSKVKYFFSDIEMLTAPSKTITMPEADVTLTLDATTLAKLRRAASALDNSKISISPKDGALEVSVVDPANATSNTFTTIIDGEYKTTDFTFVFDINNLKIIDGDYEVSISSKLISKFVNKSKGVQYWIALEKSSTFGA